MESGVTLKQFKNEHIQGSNSLFKFRGFDKNEEDICFGIDSILNTYIYATCLDELNDIFEGTVLKSIINIIESANNIQFFEMNTIDCINTKDLDSSEELRDSLRLNGMNQIKDVIRELKKLAVFSASEKLDEHLLWAHYANEWKGFAIEYDKAKLQESITSNKDLISLGGNVEYNRDLQSELVEYKGYMTPECFIPLMENIPIGPIKAVFFNKPECWRYEKEFRFAFGSNGQKKHSHNSIKAIYFGPRATQENIEELVSQVRAIKEYNHVIFKRMKSKSLSFNLEEETLNY